MARREGFDPHRPGLNDIHFCEDCGKHMRGLVGMVDHYTYECTVENKTPGQPCGQPVQSASCDDPGDDL